MRLTLPFKKGTVLIRHGDFGPAWRITRGTFRLEVFGGPQSILLQLAHSGDLVGTETLCAEPYGYTATALVDSEVQLVQVDDDQVRFDVIAYTCRQQQLRMQDMARLRSGSTSARVSHLLKILALEENGVATPLDRKDLPTLKEMAAIVDAAAETVCRELNVFLPARQYQRSGRAEWVRNANQPTAT